MRKLFAIYALTFSTFAAASTPIHLSADEALKIGTDAYIFGYPLITMEMTKDVMTNVAKPEGTRAPEGQFLNMSKYPNASFHDVTAPNADTLYSVAWLNLSKEPYILQLPNENGRYYLMPMLSAWTNVFEVPGTRTTGTNAQSYAIVGPTWHGKLPDHVVKIQAPTNIVWILGRTYCTGTPEDYAAVHKLQSEYKLFPLSYFGKSYVPAEGKVNPNIDMKTPVRDQVNNLDAAAYFKMLATSLKLNPPAPADAPMVKELAKIGIVPGQDFDPSKVSADTMQQLNKAVKAGQSRIMQHEKHAGEIVNGWVFSTQTGQYGTDYLQRAFVAYIGLGANLPQDAIYPTATTDSQGNVLNGANHYVIHFDKGQLPPVHGFWSLTMYDAKYFFVDNPLNRYTLSERDKLKSNSDGSIDLYIQHASPDKTKESNWLPAPKGNFSLMFRFYWPKESLIKGEWKLPKINKSV